MASGEPTHGYDRDRVTVVQEHWLGVPTPSYRGRPVDVLDVLDVAFRRRPAGQAVVDAATGATRTVTQLADDVAATAAAWRADGLRAGDGVAIAASNSGDHLVAILACAATGAVAVGLSTRLAVEQWRYQLQHARCRLLLTDPQHADAGAAAAAGLPDLRVLPLAGHVRTADPATAAWSTWRAARPPVRDDGVYQVVYTSGTTGRAKASQVVHRASVHSGVAYDRALRLREGESTGVFFSLGYISAMHAHVLPALLSGARLVMMSAGTPRTWVRQLSEFDVAWAYAVPSWWLLALREPGLRADDLPRLRLAGAGGSPFPDRLRDGLAERLPATELVNIYGLSETHSPATMLFGRELWSHAGAAGRPLDVVDLQVRDASGRPVDDGRPGEVWLRSSLVTTGYAHDAEATRRAVVAGWLRTGDVGVLEPDEDGPVLRLLDRVKDMVDRAGVKVYSAEVERVLAEHPSVAESAVVAQPDERAGETVAVFLVARPGAALPTDADVRAFVRGRLGTSAVPSTVRWVDDLPRGSTGKTDKQALRTRLSMPYGTTARRDRPIR